MASPISSTSPTFPAPVHLATSAPAHDADADWITIASGDSTVMQGNDRLTPRAPRSGNEVASPRVNLSAVSEALEPGFTEKRSAKKLAASAGGIAISGALLVAGGNIVKGYGAQLGLNMTGAVTLIGAAAVAALGVASYADGRATAKAAARAAAGHVELDDTAARV